MPGVGGIVGVGSDPFGEGGEETGEEGVRRRVEPEAGGSRGEEVEVLGATDGAPVHGFGVDEAGVAEALEVEPHGVGVHAETLGEVRGGQCRRRRRQLAVDGVSGLVGECLEHPQVDHGP